VTDDGEPDDRSLLAAHVAGDPDSFAVLVRRHTDRLWAVALRTVGDREEAADALQDAMVSAYRAADRYRGDAAVGTWLHRIVVNACLDRLRRIKARPTVPLEGHQIRTRHDEHAATVSRLDLRVALARLPEAQRVALVLVDLEDLPVAEVATLLGVAEGTVKSRCARARTALAVMLRPPAEEAAAAEPGDGGNRAAGGDVGTEGTARRPRRGRRARGTTEPAPPAGGTDARTSTGREAAT
jgi:RNA polymerase sigma-70 factor (ECF subfamily)